MYYCRYTTNIWLKQMILGDLQLKKCNFFFEDIYPVAILWITNVSRLQMIVYTFEFVMSVFVSFHAYESWNLKSDPSCYLGKISLMCIFLALQACCWEASRGTADSSVGWEYEYCITYLFPFSPFHFFFSLPPASVQQTLLESCQSRNIKTSKILPSLRFLVSFSEVVKLEIIPK